MSPGSIVVYAGDISPDAATFGSCAPRFHERLSRFVLADIALQTSIPSELLADGS